MADDDKGVSREVFDIVTKNHDKRIGDIEDTLKWVVRTVGGSILLAIMTLVLIGKKTGAM